MGSEGLAPVIDLKLTMMGEPEMIVPAEPTDSAPIFLSNIDQCLIIPVETVYFYPPNPNKSTDTLVDTLRSALGKVLVPYHFLAGRIRGTPQGRLEIDCNRAGSQFTHYKSGVRICDLGDVTLPNPLFRELVPSKFDVVHVFDAPVLAIQVTTFKCGGYTMGARVSHTMFDGPGAIDFFANYTSIARGEGLLFKPNYDRSLLKARDPPQVYFEHEECVELPDDLPGASSALSPFTTPANAADDFVAFENPDQYVTRVFPFNLKTIETLKKRALESGVLKRVSTFEVVLAHTWLARTKAVDLPPHMPFNLLFAVDIRKRIKPPLPEHFCGNAVYSACVRDTPARISKYTFVEAVQKIQEANQRVDDHYIRSCIDLGSLKKGMPALFGGFFLAAWWKMPFCDTDFGWGNPIYACPIITPLVEFVFLLSNGTKDGGINLVIALEPEEMKDFAEYIKV